MKSAGSLDSLFFPVPAFKLTPQDKEPIVLSVPVIIRSHNAAKRNRNSPVGMRRTAKIFEILYKSSTEEK